MHNDFAKVNENPLTGLLATLDLTDTGATITVSVPGGWKATGSAAWFRVSGTQIAATESGSQIRLTTPLTQDVLLDVVLVKA